MNKGLVFWSDFDHFGLCHPKTRLYKTTYGRILFQETIKNI